MNNLNLAFEVAEKHLDIPKMLDAEGEWSSSLACPPCIQSKFVSPGPQACRRDSQGSGCIQEGEGGWLGVCELEHVLPYSPTETCKVVAA